MSKLVCVEYVFNEYNEVNTSESPLSGLVGETLDTCLQSHDSVTEIPVRFPLVGQNSYVSLIRGDRDVVCNYELELEGDSIRKDSLYIVKNRVPVSLYKKVRYGEVCSSVNNSTYFSIYSLLKFKEYMASRSEELPFSWTWGMGKAPTKSSASNMFKSIFIEARVYHVSAALNIKGSRKFKGLAIQVIYKPQPTQKMRDEGIFIMRTCADLYILTNSEENVSYIDGTSIHREASSIQKIVNTYNRHITAKQATRTKRFTQHREEVLKSALKVVEESKKVVVKSKYTANRPPSSSQKAARSSFIGGISSAQMSAPIANSKILKKLMEIK